MKAIELPLSLTELEDGLFWGCSKLSVITIPDSVTEIGYNTFYETAWLKNRKDKPVIENSVLIDGTACIGEVVIPKKVTFICDKAFRNAKLTAVVIPEGVTIINDSCFENCENLQSVILPDSVTEIGYRAFAGCKALKEVKLPKQCERIDIGAFSDCSRMQKVTIQSGTKEIGGHAFINCTALKDMILPDSISSVGELAFYNTAWLNWIQNDKQMVIIGSVLYDASSCAGDVIIPDGVTEITNYAFNCKNEIDTVTIPDTVTSIGSKSFVNCSGLITMIAPKDSYAADYAKDFGIELASAKPQRPEKSSEEEAFPASSFGSSVIEDSENHMIYYKEGEWEENNNHTYGCVNLVALDRLSGVKKVLAQVDAGPIYLDNEFLYYTRNNGVFRVGKDGNHSEVLAELSGDDKNEFIYNLSLIGTSGNCIYYTYFIYNGNRNEEILARVGLNGTNQKILKSFGDIFSMSSAVLVNNRIYYIIKMDKGDSTLNALTLDGKQETVIDKDMSDISNLLADENSVYYLCQDESRKRVYIKRLNQAGSIKNLAEMELKLPYPARLYSVSGNNLYYTFDQDIYRLSIDGSQNELILKLETIGMDHNYLDRILVKGNWMFLQYDYDEDFNRFYCINLKDYSVWYLGEDCYFDSFDATYDAIYYRVGTVPEDAWGARESVYRRWKPLEYV